MTRSEVFFGELQGVGNVMKHSRVFDIYSQSNLNLPTELEWNRQNLCFLRSHIQTTVMVLISFFFNLMYLRSNVFEKFVFRNCSNHLRFEIDCSSCFAVHFTSWTWIDSEDLPLATG